MNNPFYSKNNNNGSNGNMSPFYSSAISTAGGLYNALNDNNNYNQSSNLADLGKIGSTDVGQLGQTLGDAAIATGNPAAMLGGVAAKSLFGLGDVLSYLGSDRDVNITGGDYNSNELATYDLGDDAKAIHQARNTNIVAESAKKAGVLAPIGAIAGLFAKGKQKKYVKEAENKLRDAGNRFNTSTQGYYDKQNARSLYESQMLDSRRASQNLFGNTRYY